MSEGGASKISRIEESSNGSKKSGNLSGKTITVTSNEGDSFEVPIEFSNHCKLLDTNIDESDEENSDEENSDEESEEEEEIPLPNISTEMLRLIIKFLYYTVNNNPVPEIPQPIQSNDLYEILGQDNKWYADFMNSFEVSMLFNVINAANYLDCKTLLNLGCVKVASIIKGKTPEQIRTTFNIENDFSPEEEKKVREENKWAEKL